MAGRLEEFRLGDLLQAVGASPQCTAIELRRDDGELQGTIWIQGGRVIGAERGRERTGRDAFYELFGLASADNFIVSRTRQPQQQTLEPLGSVVNLILEAMKRLAKGSQVTALPPTARAQPTGWEEPTRARAVRRGGVTIAIASARGGVGRSTVTAQLARALARAGRRVMVIDADRAGDAAVLAGVRAPAPQPLSALLDTVDAIDDALQDGAGAVRVLATAPPPPGRHSVAADWHALLARARARAAVVLVDCPVGVEGLAGDVLSGCSHVLGVVRADRVAGAAAATLEAHLDTLPGEVRPHLTGVVVNLLDDRSAPSVAAYQQLTRERPVLATTIPRLDALAGSGDATPRPVELVFDTLAAEVAQRIGL